MPLVSFCTPWKHQKETVVWNGLRDSKSLIEKRKQPEHKIHRKTPEMKSFFCKVADCWSLALLKKYFIVVVLLSILWNFSEHVFFAQPGPILGSKGHACDFSEKEQKRAKYLKIWAKMYKIWKYFWKGHPHACDYRMHERTRICQGNCFRKNHFQN